MSLCDLTLIAGKVQRGSLLLEISCISEVHLRGTLVQPLSNTLTNQNPTNGSLKCTHDRLWFCLVGFVVW
jgi:hypothetical protein